LGYGFLQLDSEKCGEMIGMGKKKIKREDISRKKIKKVNNLRGLIHGEKFPWGVGQSVTECVVKALCDVKSSVLNF
jgi:hypothetical protein